MSTEMRANRQTIEDDFVEDDFTDEDWEIYTRSVEESDGFDVVVPPNLYIPDGIVPVDHQWVEVLEKARYEKWGRYALEEHNKHESKSLELVKVIKANVAFAAGVFYYLTLLVNDKEANDPAMSHLVCRAKVWDGFRGDKELVSFKIVTGEKYW